MNVTEKPAFITFLDRFEQADWNRVLTTLLGSVHPVDQAATRIWFGFWPLDLCRALRDDVGPEEMARIMDLEGKWRLEEQIDGSVSFLYGARHWPAVKREVLDHVSSFEVEPKGDLDEHIHSVARHVAADTGEDVSLVLGITAVAFMILQQVGMERLRSIADRPAEGPLHRNSPRAVLRKRLRKRGGIMSFVKGTAQTHRVTWDELSEGAQFQALHDQDLAMAAAADSREYRKVDYRRIEGPLPVECRIGSCGYCWVGIVSGRENLSEMSDFERQRLRYFGYDSTNAPDDPKPHIRLGCQTQCRGDVTLVIPPWNGELNRRFDKTAKELGTV